MLKVIINKKEQAHFHISLNGAACKKHKIALSFRILDWDALLKLALLQFWSSSHPIDKKTFCLECDYQGQ